MQLTHPLLNKSFPTLLSTFSNNSCQIAFDLNDYIFAPNGNPKYLMGRVENFQPNKAAKDSTLAASPIGTI